MLSIRFLMSSVRQAVIFSDSFTGLGYFPDFTPDHHEDLDTGIIGGVLVDLSPMICFSLRKPIAGRFIVQPHVMLINLGYFSTCIVV